MRAPPPVEHVSSLGRAWRAALACIVAASVAVPLAWALPYLASHGGSRQPDPFFAALADPAVQGGIASWIGLMVFAAAWMARQSHRASERTLRWDDQDWVLPAFDGHTEQRGDASLMLDLGPWMLVRFLPVVATRAGGVGATWLPFHMASDLARWAALRGALWNWRADEHARGRDSTGGAP
jgi:hypothetical protein